MKLPVDFTHTYIKQIVANGYTLLPVNIIAKQTFWHKRIISQSDPASPNYHSTSALVCSTSLTTEITRDFFPAGFFVKNKNICKIPRLFVHRV